jgi:peptide deformylase
MAIRNILKEGEPALRKRSREVRNFDRRLWELLDDMVNTMQEVGGAGLAAPQVGVLRRVAVVEGPEGVIELVNPVITETEGEQMGVEGCLSFPGIYGIVTRPAKVTVTAQDRHGRTFSVTGEGIVARAFSHETDHLDGVLFVDKVERYLTEEELRALNESEEEIEENGSGE